MSSQSPCHDHGATYCALCWAKVNGEHYRYRCAQDNYSPTRDTAYGSLWRYQTPDGTPAILIDSAMCWRDGTNAVYLVDDGRTVRPFYVATYHPDRSYVVAHAMPTDYREDGTRRVREDDGRPVSFSTWNLGPQRAYHLKVSRAEV